MNSPPSPIKDRSSDAFQSPGTIKWTIGAILRLLKNQSRHRKIQILGMVFFQLIVAQFEVITIGALIPVLTLTIGRGESEPHEFILLIQERLAMNEDELIVLFCIIFVAMISLVNLLRLANAWIQLRLVASIGSDIAAEYFGSSLSQDYEYSIQKGPSRLKSNVLHDMNSCIAAVGGLFNLSLNIFSVGFIVTAAILYDPGITLSVAFAAVLFYVLTDRVSRRRVVREGELRSKLSADLMVAMREAYAQFIDVVLTGSRSHFIGRFRSCDSLIRHSVAVTNFIRIAPRFAFESVIAIVLGVVIFGFWSTGTEIVTLLPNIATIGFAFTRMLPGAQQVYAAISGLRAAQVPLQNIWNVLDRPPDPLQQDGEQMALEIKDAVCVEGAWYRYEPTTTTPEDLSVSQYNSTTGEAEWVLRDLSIRCPARQVTAVTGRTGSGKTTLANVLATLLPPQQGGIIVDGVELDITALQRWRHSVAYVPQTIKLIESTVLENIAFGIDPTDVDEARVRDAAERAQIADFIEQLPGGYWQRIGEDGISLSGGQRQRLAIARAIYRKAQMIILDEATSSLDNETERAVMDAIYSLSGEVTLLIIAHRLSTIRRADLVYYLESGQVTDFGTFDELVARSQPFQKVVSATDERILPS